MNSRKFTSERDGIERTLWEVTATEMQMLDPKGAAGSGGSAGGSGGAGYGDDMGADDVPF